ncbi:Transcriptional regulator cudA [Entamoeba marina]
MNPINENENQDFIISYHHKLPHEERQLLDGSTKTVGVVVKQSSFLVVIVSHTVSLDDCSVDCSLLYDNATLSQVHFINQKPITFSSQISGNNSMNVELRILVLSSQHEDMLFRVKFELYNKLKEKITTLYSEPLRVISKADSGKKKNKTVKKSAPLTPTAILPQQNKPIRPTLAQRKENVPPQQTSKEITDLDKEGITLILQYQQSILRELSQQNSSNPLTQPLTGMLNAYLSLPQTQRIPQLLRFVSTLSPQESAVVSELIEVYSLSLNTLKNAY